MILEVYKKLLYLEDKDPVEEIRTVDRLLPVQEVICNLRLVRVSYKGNKEARLTKVPYDSY
jgi:hypothetical protein